MKSAFDEAGVTIMAVSVDPPADLKTARGKSRAQFTFLSDHEGRLMDQFNLRDKGGNPAGGDVARSALFLLDSSGTVLWSHQSPNYRVRPQAEAVLAEVKQAIAAR